MKQEIVMIILGWIAFVGGILISFPMVKLMLLGVARVLPSDRHHPIMV